MSDYLPKDVLIDILKRLPLKSVVQCTCICKSWYSLITNPSFISTHLNHTIEHNAASNNHLLFVRHYDMFQNSERCALHCDNETFDEYVELECPFVIKNEYLRIVGCCNGLICLSDDYDSHTDTMIIWNPLIRKWVTLPEPKLAFDGRGSCLLGFGFDALRNDYKVVRIVYYSNLPENYNYKVEPGVEPFNNLPEIYNYNYRVPPSVELYTLSSGAWRSISDAALPYVVYNTSPSPAFANGAVHWVASNDDDKSNPGNLIVAFDMGAEVFREMTMPDRVAHRDVIKLSVMVMGTSLACIEYEKIWQSDYCWVWLMKEYGVAESWTRLFTIDLREGIRNVVGFRKSDEIMLSARVVGLVSYDPQTKEIKYLGIHGTNRSFYAGTYVESLVLLERVNGVLVRPNSSDAVTDEGAPLLPREEGRVEEQQ